MKKYEILGKLGQGGMGVVYKAVQKNLNREVAIKVLPKAYSENDEVKRRFVSEMQICGSLVHPNIIRIFDNGEQDGTLYYVMEYVPGTSLLELVQSQGPLAVEQALRVTADLCEAMKYYHPKGLVHRDIKPANIMVKPGSGQAVLMDFGLVKALYASGITLQGRLVGTPRYMSPEMLRGSAVDGRSDIFQLGLVLYEMCAGVPAFRGKDRAEVTRKLLEEDPEPASQLNPKVTPQVEVLIANAVEKNMDVRYQSAEEFLQDVTALRERKTLSRRGGAREMPALTPGDLAAPAVSDPSAAPVPIVAAPTRQMVPELAMRTLGTAGLSKLLLGLLLILAATAYLLYPRAAPSYTVLDLRADVDFSQALIRWRSERPYPTAIEYGESEALMKPLAPPGASQSETAHEVTVKGLSEGSEYRYRILFPDGQTSRIYELRTPSLYFASFDVKRVGLEALQIEARTSAEVRGVLEFRKGGEQGRRTGGSAHGTVHPFRLDGLGPAEAVAVRVVAISRSGAEKASEWMDVPSPASEARRVAAMARGLRLDSWFQRLAALGSDRTAAVELGRQLDDWWKAQPLYKKLRSFQEIAPAYFASRLTPLADKVSTFESLTGMGDVNHLCALRGVPFRFPVEQLLPAELSASPRRRLETQENYAKQILDPFVFRPSAAVSPGGGGEEPSPEARNDEELVIVRLDRTEGIEGAELLLAMKLPPPGQGGEAPPVFRVRLNDLLTISFRPVDASQGKSLVKMHHTFDSRVLRAGENRIVIRLEGLPAQPPPRGEVKLCALLVERG